MPNSVLRYGSDWATMLGGDGAVRVPWALLAAGWACSAAAPLAAGASDASEFFETSVRPVLAGHCYQCHSRDAPTVFAQLRLDSGPALLRGGRSGPAVVPGDPDASRLIRALRHEAGPAPMPPAGKLREREIADLEEWVRQGAAWPEESASDVEPGGDGQPSSPRDHWAWQPLAELAWPEVDDGSWSTGPIDRFVLARLEAAGIAPVEPADRYTLLRRLALDLTGLPLAPWQVHAFARLPGRAGLGAAVDSLLASPAFGERWGRHWLDLAAYADTLGLGRRIPAPSAWRYRDYVIEAFNSDKPYNRFVREQVAGDVLPFQTDAQRREQLIATGFLSIGPWALVDQDKLQLQMDVVDHQIDTVGRALLGITLGCARCHDHKFDPVPQRDYYALAGIFRSTRTLEARMSGVFSDVRRTALPETPEELRARADALIVWQAEYDEAVQAQKWAEERVEALRKELQRSEAVEAGGDGAKELSERLAAAQSEARANETEAARILHYGKPAPPAALALADDPEPEDARICLGGNPRSLGLAVPRGFLSIVPAQAPAKIANRRLIGTGFQKSSGRLELADWLFDPGNPLPARVMANRVWQHLFGRGIVASVDNFGTLGERPTHPALLDYLALRLRSQDWSVKALVREIVLSSAYGLSAAHDQRAGAVDPDNLLLWRANRRRLEAEAIRDSVLHAAGSLDFRAGGPSLPLRSRGSVVMAQPPFLARSFELGAALRNRRTVYLPALRKSQLKQADVLNLFDFPDPNTVAGRRDVTTVPTQALYLMNSPFLVKQSAAAAKALLAGTQRSDEARVRAFLLRALGRPATEADVDRALRYLSGAGPGTREQAWARYCHSVFASNEFLFRG